MNENYEMTYEESQKIKRDYEDATPWRNFAIAICLSSTVVMTIINIFLITTLK